MKSFPSIRAISWLSGLYLAGASLLSASPLITFDDLSPVFKPGSYLIITNGYGGLDWSNFQVINGYDFNWNLGYRSGIVSPDNVASTVNDAPSTISSSQPFDLNSAYVTALLTKRIRIQVLGFLGSTLKYDNVYEWSGSDPSLVHFNYLGVDQVKFVPLPSGVVPAFVLDNLDVTLLRPVDIGNVEVPTLAHSFLKPPGPVGLNFVRDFLIDQRQLSGGGAVLPSFTANFDSDNRVTISISAPPGKKFLIQPPAGQLAHFGGTMSWRTVNLSGGPEERVAIRFEGLEGNPPDVSESFSRLAPSHGEFLLSIRGTKPIAGAFAFSSVKFTATLNPKDIGSGPLTYSPKSDSVLGCTYITSGTSDPGSFVSIVSGETVLPVAAQSLVTSIRPSGMMVSWISSMGKQYQVRFKESLTSGTWINLGPARTGTGDTLEQPDTSGDTSRFYQVMELP